MDITTSSHTQLTTGTRARKRRFSWLPYLLILPTLIFVVVFTLWPSLATVYNSLFRANQAVRVPQFIGLGNYLNLIQDPVFLQVLRNTALFVVTTVPLSMGLGLALALLLNQKLRAIGIFRLAIFYPTILPLVSAATIWLFMYTPDYGVVATFLRPFGIRGQNWLGNPDLALWAIIVMTIWKQTGYYMIFYLAGIQNLPQDVFEAVALDGATLWQEIRYITFPLLSATTLFVTTIAVVAAFQMVDQVYIMTQGGPDNASNLLMYHIYETQFRFQDRGEANAMTVLLVLILLMFTISNFLWFEGRTTYESD
ncbi:MAG: sugar ABC transporter permease [Anaerolineae bacterium]